MNKGLGGVLLLGLLALPLTAQQAPPFAVNRMVACTNVENYQPVGEAESFPAATEKVWCFLDAGQIAADTTVTFVWYCGDKEYSRLSLPIKAGSRWVTYAWIYINSRTGDWKVDLQDAAGNSVKSLAFKIQ